jgi:hypothetical protein
VRRQSLPVPEGSQRVQSNEVTTDDPGLFYLLDRLRGLTILERCWRRPPASAVIG